MFAADNSKCAFCIFCFRDRPSLQDHAIFSNVQLCKDCAAEYLMKLSVFEHGVNVSKLAITRNVTFVTI